MSSELISKATRNEFREVLVGFVLREIDMIFEAGGLEPRIGFEAQVGGQRRGLVEAYYANIDFCAPAAVRKLLAAYEEIIEQLRQSQGRVVNPEAVDVTINNLLRRMERDGFRYENGRFVSDSLNLGIVEAPSLVQLTEASIIEHVDKARSKIANGDPAGAISNAYTLVEDFLKQLLRRTATPFNESEGDIRALYKVVTGPLKLEPKGDHLENYLKAILEGLQRQIGGLFEIANKASDRHARRYNPAPHHAKLAVNAAFTLCEFLLESHQYQQQRSQRKLAS
jgi:hypothetical protein